VARSRKSLILQLSTGELFTTETGALFVFNDLLALLIKLQTNFLPDLMQVKVLFPTVDLIPTLVHLAPALVAAFAGISGSNTKIESIDKIAISLLFIYKG
jgi:hypothetical protein